MLSNVREEEFVYLNSLYFSCTVNTKEKEEKDEKNRLHWDARGVYEALRDISGL